MWSSSSLSFYSIRNVREENPILEKTSAVNSRLPPGFWHDCRCCFQPLEPHRQSHRAWTWKQLKLTLATFVQLQMMKNITPNRIPKKSATLELNLFQQPLIVLMCYDLSKADSAVGSFNSSDSLPACPQSSLLNNFFHLGRFMISILRFQRLPD